MPMGGKSADPDLTERIDAESEATSSPVRLWDDSMIPPEDTRKVLALGLSTMLGGCPLEQIDLWCLQHAPAS